MVYHDGVGRREGAESARRAVSGCVDRRQIARTPGCSRARGRKSMAGLRFGDVANHPPELLDLTSLTGAEFAALVGPFEAAFQAHMAQWRFDGRPRTAR